MNCIRDRRTLMLIPLFAAALIAVAGGCGSEMEREIEGRWYGNIMVEEDSIDFNVALRLDFPKDKDRASIVAEYYIFRTAVATCSIPGRWSVGDADRLVLVPDTANATVRLSREYMDLLKGDGYSDSAIILSEHEMLREAMISSGDRIDMRVTYVSADSLCLSSPDGSAVFYTRNRPPRH